MIYERVKTMEIKELRACTGLSQNKFANMFEIPVATLKDWEQGRRTPPGYVVNMIKTILEYQGLYKDTAYLEACEQRRKSVEKMLAVLFTATKGPDASFMDAVESYIYGKITLDELESNVDQLTYLGV